MSDDRILFLPPIWAPDPDVIGNWPAFQALLQRLSGTWPVDFVRWPTLRGEAVEGTGWEAAANALRRSLRPEHHVVGYAFGALQILIALAEKPPRSLIHSFLRVTPGTLEAAGYEAAAVTQRARLAIVTTPAQALAGAMRGARPETIRAAAAALEATLDRSILLQLMNDPVQDRDIRGSFRPLDIPALCLLQRTRHSDSVGEINLEFGRAFLPSVQVDFVRETYGWHRREPGEEFADKAIPFIQEVIAQREAASQT
jgi:hypothetical protein